MALFNSDKDRKPAASEYNHIPFLNIPSSLNFLPELGLQNPVQEPSTSYLDKPLNFIETTPPSSSTQHYQTNSDINENASLKSESTLPESNTLSPTSKSNYSKQ